MQTLCQKKTALTQPASSQHEEIKQQANAEHDNLLDVLLEETSSTASSFALSESLEQIMEMLSCSSSSSDMAHAKKDCRVATIEQQQLEHPEFYFVLL